MAAPAEITIQDLNGRFCMDKTVSNDADPILSLQGISWLTRKAIGIATITLHVKEYKDDDGTVHIDIAQTLTGGISGTTEHRTLNWDENEHSDHIFGTVKGRSRFVRGAAGADGKIRPAVEVQTKAGNEKDQEAVARFLSGEILADGSATEGFVAGEGEDYWVHSWVESVNDGWTAEQIWGFENINGVRKYTRRVVAEKKGKVIKARLVYDFLGREA
ncbi:uncharacterized protein CIMG_00615 [Coccidioides immitis RS]|uniref:LCCL domain-containing protein n=4 Tax=Coccidioides immitis TaxID=5501 RepID=A0A0E1RY65_COCIM|nr:uncharacterized protein CIMG_00615 [Coccidioides immitis RS]KMP00502.1 hypothetical protein CIRG_00643 [Coccidioides immitis RMSCC 2394]KMU75977.1 hypothetical protein CISG_05463 [Coccidioides immitis RMSCC 3703]KMU89503.1 hypothetical protein CIHG_07309 [Coccidioides immitis H538.4]TPX26462.1 hypothetical protein DIZ76_011924 [Coccidioides immitis]EAS35261.2 hypothetical protein CIMG_00615 [Coccidioides immitis RS]